MNRGEGVCRNSIDITLTIDGDTASAIISEADHSADKTLVVAADGAILIAIRPTKRGSHGLAERKDGFIPISVISAALCHSNSGLAHDQYRRFKVSVLLGELRPVLEMQKAMAYHPMHPRAGDLSTSMIMLSKNGTRRTLLVPETILERFIILS